LLDHWSLAPVFLFCKTPTRRKDYDEEKRRGSEKKEKTYKAVAQKKAPALLSHLLMIWVGSQ
jgi:hypothetical protein